jgi:hypothetical protein
VRGGKHSVHERRAVDPDPAPSLRDQPGHEQHAWAPGPSRVLVQPYTTFAVPYWWMLRSNQQAIEERMADPLARDIEPPFDSKWVFSATRQQELLTHVFDQVRPQSSLALFYTKSGHPLDERHRRLLIGVGTITAVDHNKLDGHL